MTHRVLPAHRLVLFGLLSLGLACGDGRRTGGPRDGGVDIDSATGLEDASTPDSGALDARARDGGRDAGRSGDAGTLGDAGSDAGVEVDASACAGSLCSCAGGAGFVETTFDGSNGSVGAMFDVVANEDTLLRSLEGVFDVGAWDVVLFYRRGTHVGFEESGEAWTELGRGTVNATRDDLATAIPVDFRIPAPAGSRHAFYVTLARNNRGVRYSNASAGAEVGDIWARSDQLQVLLGVGKLGLFGTTTSSPRMWNGTIRYERCP